MTPEPTDPDGPPSPDELAQEDERIEVLEENRYLVRPEQPSASNDLEAVPDDLREIVVDDKDDESTGPDLETNGSASAWLESAPEPHGVTITLKTDGELTTHRGTSHDVREVFVDLIEWYAGQLDDDLSPEEVLQVMLATSDLDV